MCPDNSQIRKLYYSISEVSKITGLKQYVLRYWETEFTVLSPTKNRAGQRIYREKDLQIVEKIKHLLYQEGYTISGANKKISTENMASPQPSQRPLPNNDYRKTFDQIKKDYPSTYRYYPQIFLVSRLILLGNCFYWDKPINTENHIAKDTHPLDDSGVGYFGLGSRWTTHKEMVDFLKKLSSKEKDNKKAQALYLVQKKRLFKVIRQAIENERPELLIDFDRGFINRISGLFYSSLINLFLHPINSLKKILRLLSLKE